MNSSVEVSEVIEHGILIIKLIKMYTVLLISIQGVFFWVDTHKHNHNSKSFHLIFYPFKAFKRGDKLLLNGEDGIKIDLKMLFLWTQT